MTNQELQELAVECGGLCARGTVILELSELQAFAEAVASEVKAENECICNCYQKRENEINREKDGQAL